METSLATYFKDKDLNTLNIEDIKKLFNVAGLKDNIPKIEPILSKDTKISDVKSLLYSKIENLYHVIDLKEDEEKGVFAKYRALVRYADITKRPKINFSKKELNRLSEDEICQVFQQEIEEKSYAQCIEWFLIIEDQGWDGSTLLELEIADVCKEMKLNDKQKIKYKKLIKKFGKDEDSKSGTSTIMNVSQASAGVIAAGGQVKTGTIYTDGNSQKKKRKNDTTDSE